MDSVKEEYFQVKDVSKDQVIKTVSHSVSIKPASNSIEGSQDVASSKNITKEGSHLGVRCSPSTLPSPWLPVTDQWPD